MADTFISEESRTFTPHVWVTEKFSAKAMRTASSNVKRYVRNSCVRAAVSFRPFMKMFTLVSSNSDDCIVTQEARKRRSWTYSRIKHLPCFAERYSARKRKSLLAGRKAALRLSTKSSKDSMEKSSSCVRPQAQSSAHPVR
ncbi:hypothetical protein H310_04686 [Aphanomyces invadans]|uniref:Uncharacterized protein n=1 Tax=Aphanomyces invadans TaxID=157072 RepID=A0A024UE04_9STRA|nr:hypothetical protein H310_04686 [Aphanomyces invadans]ETW04405.1 hypothetical protein H310_04686 [Aphanomyces invadans]|eukprot:XP_008867361.1 hypothetical protein H310_04686 [Aphanomyces invadans]